jgi:hypothetical protein
MPNSRCEPSWKGLNIMRENEPEKGLLHLPSDQLQGTARDRQLARSIVQRDRRRVRLLAVLAVVLWSIAAAGVSFAVYSALFHLYPKQHQLMHDTALGRTTPERANQIQSLHFRALEICTLVIASSFVAATLAMACTVGLVLASRQATLRQISASLAEIHERLQEQPNRPASEPGEE